MFVFCLSVVVSQNRNAGVLLQSLVVVVIDPVEFLACLRACFFLSFFSSSENGWIGICSGARMQLSLHDDPASSRLCWRLD